MTRYIFSLAILCLLVPFSAFAVPYNNFPNPQKLQPPVQNVKPDVSHNVERNADDFEVVQQENQTQPSTSVVQTPQPQEPQQSGSGYFLWVIAGIMIAIVLVFAYFFSKF